MAVHARNRYKVAEAERIKIIQFHRRFADLVAFIDGEHHRLAAAHQHPGDLTVLRGHARAQVGDHDDAVGRVDRDLRLLAHVQQQAVVNMRLDTAGVDEQKFMPAPFAVTEDAVAGNAGRIFHDRDALAGQFVEDRGFPHIGAAHNGHNRFCHSVRSPFLAGAPAACGAA